MKTYSTVEVAELLEISWDTLNRWIREKRFDTPPVQSLGRIRVRLWTEEDLEKVRAYKAGHYWGKGGRKKRKKRTK
jgi:predicted site-specific integrase-resolvase